MQVPLCLRCSRIAAQRPCVPARLTQHAILAGVLDFHGDPVALTSARVDLASDSRHGARIADEIETALRVQTSGCEIVHHGDAVLARTQLGRPSRVLLAARTDTVSAAVFLHLAATVADPAHDLTVVMYDSEKTEASADGLGRIERELPDWLSADIAMTVANTSTPTGSSRDLPVG